MDSAKGDILYVGEDPDFRSLITHTFAQTGRKVFICSRQEAQALLSQRAFDLLILNWAGEADRDVEAYKELCRLAPGTQARLFVGLFTCPGAQQAIRDIGVGRIQPLTIYSLMDFGKPRTPPSE